MTPITPDLTKTNLASTATIPGAAQATAGAYTGQGYDAAKATNTDWSVSAPQTVQGQIQGIIANNSPLLQLSRTQALQGMNSRGLLNSSIAEGAAQEAVLKTALPIAQQDAQTQATSAQFNANAKNNTDQLNTNAVNTARQFGAGATNQSNQFNAQNQTQNSQFNATSSNQVAQFNTQQQNAQEQYNVGQLNDQVKTTLDQNNKVQLMQIEAQYKTVMQANQSADSIYQQAIKNIADIQTNKDLDATAKSTMITQQMTYLQTGMKLISQLNNLPGLGDLIKTA